MAAPGELGVGRTRPERQTERVLPTLPAVEGGDETGEERIAAPHRVAPSHVQPSLEERAVRRRQDHALRPPGDDARVAVAAGHVPDLRRRRERIVPARGGNSQELTRLCDVQFHHIRMRRERDAQSLTLGVERHVHSGDALLRDQIAVPLVGSSARHRSGDREPAARGASRDRGMGQLDPRRLRRDGAVLVELREARRLPVGDREGRAVLPVRPDELAFDAFGRERLLQPPPAVASQQRDRAYVGTERLRRARHVQSLAARDLHEAGGPVDVALDESFDLEQSIDRRVRGEADDHRPTIPACPGSFSSRATSPSSTSTRW